VETQCTNAGRRIISTQSALFIFRVEIDEDNPLHPRTIFVPLSLSRSRAILATWRVEKIKSRREVRGHSSPFLLCYSLNTNGMVPNKNFLSFWRSNIIFKIIFLTIISRKCELLARQSRDRLNLIAVSLF